MFIGRGLELLALELNDGLAVSSPLPGSSVPLVALVVLGTLERLRSLPMAELSRLRLDLSHVTGKGRALGGLLEKGIGLST